MNNNQFTQPDNIHQPHPPPVGETPAPTAVQALKPPQRRTLFLALGALIFMIIVTGLLFGVYLFSSRGAKGSSWQNVKPGSTKEEAVKILGTPMEEMQATLGKMLLYQSDNKTLPNAIILDGNNKVSSIFVQVPLDEPIKFSEWLKSYGQPEKEMYNAYSESTKTYIFAQKGVAAVANRDLDQIYSTHYFKPTTLEYYLSQWGSYLFEENPYLY